MRRANRRAYGEVEVGGFRGGSIPERVAVRGECGRLFECECERVRVRVGMRVRVRMRVPGARCQVASGRGDPFPAFGREESAGLGG